MDCDDVTLLLAGGASPTPVQAAALAAHLATCEPCRRLAEADDARYRWLVRVPIDAVGAGGAGGAGAPLGLPVVDPIVFTTSGPLAKGGMGQITRAHDRRLDREVAIKEMLDPSLRDRFEREALITARLQHPAIIPIYEAGTWPDGSPFYTMRLVAGGTLHDAIARSATFEDRLALLPHFRALTEALAYAHSRRVIHRDLKPGNVLVGEFGETVVIDWGLAKQLDHAPDLPLAAPPDAAALAAAPPIPLDAAPPIPLDAAQPIPLDAAARSPAPAGPAQSPAGIARGGGTDAESPRAKRSADAAPIAHAAHPIAEAKTAVPVALPIAEAATQVGNAGGSGEPGLTRVGSVLGTAGFMAPEQAAGHEVNERADVYALGAILYTVLTGHPPYADLDVDKISAVLLRPPTPIATLAPRTPADLRAIVERAMAQRADDRYPTAQQLAEDLRRFEAGQLLKSREYGLRELFGRWLRRHRTAVTAGTLALVAIAAIGISALVGITRSEAREREARHAAEQARAAADTDNATLLEEQGRTELLSGDRRRALAYLSAAYRRGRDTVALRHLLTTASRDLELFDHAIEPKRDKIVQLGFAPRAPDRAVSIDHGTTGTITIWDGARRLASHPVKGGVRAAWLSPDTRRAAVLTTDSQLALYDTDAGRVLWTLDARDPDEPRRSRGTSVVFSPTAAQLVVLDTLLPQSAQRSPQPPQLRDTETGALIAELAGPTTARSTATARPRATNGSAATANPATPPGSVATTSAAGHAAACCAAFSADGRRVAVGLQDGTIEVSQLGAPAPMLRWQSPHPASAIAFAGSDAVVTGSADGAAELRHLDGSPPVSLTAAGDPSPIETLGVSPDGTRVATGDQTGAVRLWSATGDLLGESRDARSLINELRFSPDGNLLLGDGTDDRILVWDTPSLAVRGVVTASAGGAGANDALAPSQIAWSADGTQFAAVGGNAHRALVFRTPAGNRIARFATTSAALAGPFVMSAHDGSLEARALTTGELRRRLDDRFATTDRDDITLASAGRRLVVQRHSVARIYDLTTGKLERELPSPASTTSASSAAATPAPTPAASPGSAARPAMHPAVFAVLSPDGKLLLEGGGDNQASGARILDAASGRVIRTLTVPGATGGAIAPDGDHVVLVFSTQPSRMWQVATGKELALHGIAATAARFDPTGRRLTQYGLDPSTVTDLATGATIATFSGAREASIETAAFDATGDHLVTLSYAGAAKLWDLTTRTVLLAADAVSHDGAAISPDGKRLATGGEDGTIRIWDATTARLLEIIRGEHAGPALTWSPDGSRLLATYEDHATAALWDVHLASPADVIPLADRASGWKLVDGQLVATTPAAP